MPEFRWKNKKIFYQEKGKGQPIIFLHCWTGNHKFYKNQVEELSKDFRCLAFDFPGHGNSDEANEYGPIPFSKIISSFINQLKFQDVKFILVGHSLGGMTAMQTTLDNPERIKALILVDTSAHLRGHLGQHGATPVIAGISPFFTETMKRAGIDFTAVHPLCNLKVRKFIKDEIVKVKNSVLTEVLNGINSFNVKKRLKEIKVPTLIIVGTADIYTDIRHALTLRLGIKNSKLALILGAGHMGVLEQPAQVNKAMRCFLDQLE